MVIMASRIVASSRGSVSWDAAQKMVREKIRERKIGEKCSRKTIGHSSIPQSVILSDWSIFTGFVNARALLMQTRNAIWPQSETF